MKKILSKMIRHRLLPILLAFALAPAVSRAQTSQYMSYQGYLTDGNGNALGNTNTGPKAYDVVFRIWDSPTGGNEIFSELQTVTVDNGYFSVLLGQGTAYAPEPTLHVPLANVFTNSSALSRYVEVTVLGIGVNNFITILPRLQLVSAPFAFQAASALNITGTNAITAANFSTNLGAWQATGTNIYYAGGNVAVNNISFSGVLSGNISASSVGNNLLNTNGNGLVLNTNLLALLNPVLFKDTSGNHGVGYQSSTTNFSALNAPDGPILWGYNGGALGSMNTGAKLGLVWTQLGHVGIGTTNPQSNNLQINPYYHGANGYGLQVNNTQYGENIQVNEPAGGGGDALIIDNHANGDGSTSLLLARNNVGTSPQNLLNLTCSGSLTVAGLDGGYYFADRVSGPNWALYATSGNAYIWNSQLGNAITVAGANNYVGIGTTSPQFPLDVESYNEYNNVPGYEYLNGGQVGHYNGGGSIPISIWCSQRMGASEYEAFSDARIKNVIGVSSGARDLETLRAIQVTDFTYKDVVAKGNRLFKKAIAQQVEKVYPQAVSKQTGVVPDIFQKAGFKDGWVQLATDLKVGERVKLIAEKAEGVYPVLQVRDGAFRTEFKSSTDRVFVYGREVNDFRSIDYDAIAMLNVSATQELAKRLEKLETRESRLAELEKKAAKVETLEKELADLKKTVAQLAQAAKDAKLTDVPVRTETAAELSFATSSLKN